MNDDKTPATVDARYTARVRGSWIKMNTPELPLELNQMIVWIMHSGADAMDLLPAYREIRKRAEDRRLSGEQPQ